MATSGRITACLSELFSTLGAKPRLLASIKRLRGSGKSRAEEAIAHMGRAAASPNTHDVISPSDFGTANVRVGFPDADDPLRYQQQIIASEANGFEGVWPESDLPG
jgi:hypothetical protein